MYWFGKTLDSTDRSWLKDEAWTEISSKRLALSMTPLEDILNLLDKFSAVWKDQAVMKREVIPSLLKDSGFSKEEVQRTLSLLPGLLSRESLEKRVKAEFTRSEVLDGFTKLPNMTAKMKAVPNGPLLHVTAGNVFLSSIDSLVMGFLTKNISVVK